jgi:hypothetical protein
MVTNDGERRLGLKLITWLLTNHTGRTLTVRGSRLPGKSQLGGLED